MSQALELGPEYFMQQAYKLAQQAFEEDEVSEELVKFKHAKKTHGRIFLNGAGASW